MEEVEGYLNGETDYRNLRGNTGPLVYPAGFLYVYSALRYFTNEGRDIFTAQCIFVGIYMFNLCVVLGMYFRNKKIPAILTLPLILSKRIHSIFMLRMFNDCIAAMLGYLAIFLFTYRQWELGSVIYSSAVSIKMNMLLYAPGIFLVLLLGTGLSRTCWCIGLCAVVQVVLGYPFLSTYPFSYLGKAFELGRVFEYQWTVNYRFLSEEIFVSKTLALGLLALTVLGYVIFMVRWITQVTKHSLFFFPFVCAYQIVIYLWTLCCVIFLGIVVGDSRSEKGEEIVHSSDYCGFVRYFATIFTYPLYLYV